MSLKELPVYESMIPKINDVTTYNNKKKQFHAAKVIQRWFRRFQKIKILFT